jgi:hypothetical protein
VKWVQAGPHDCLSFSSLARADIFVWIQTGCGGGGAGFGGCGRGAVKTQHLTTPASVILGHRAEDPVSSLLVVETGEAKYPAFGDVWILGPEAEDDETAWARQANYSEDYRKSTG